MGMAASLNKDLKLNYVHKMTLDSIQILLIYFNIILAVLMQSLFVFNNSRISLFQFRETIIISNKMDKIKSLILLLKINVLCLDMVRNMDVIASLVAIIIKMIFG